MLVFFGTSGDLGYLRGLADRAGFRTGVVAHRERVEVLRMRRQPQAGLAHVGEVLLRGHPRRRRLPCGVRQVVVQAVGRTPLDENMVAEMAPSGGGPA